MESDGDDLAVRLKHGGGGPVTAQFGETQRELDSDTINIASTGLVRCATPHARVSVRDVK